MTMPGGRVALAWGAVALAVVAALVVVFLPSAVEVEVAPVVRGAFERTIDEDAHDVPGDLLELCQREEELHVHRQEEVTDAQELRLALGVGVGQPPEVGTILDGSGQDLDQSRQPIAFVPAHQFAHPVYPPLWSDLIATSIRFGAAPDASASAWQALLTLALAAACWHAAGGAPAAVRGLAAAAGAWVPTISLPVLGGYAEPLVAFLCAAALATLPAMLRGERGGVAGPGSYEVIGPRTLLEMLGKAGGLKENAGNVVHVVRHQSYSEINKAKNRGEAKSLQPYLPGSDITEINLDKLINDGALALNVPIKNGDVIYVPFAKSAYVLDAVN